MTTQNTPPQPPKQSIRAEVARILCDFEGKTISDVQDAMNGRPGARTFGVSDYPRETAEKELLALLASELKAVAAEMPEKMYFNPVYVPNDELHNQVARGHNNAIDQAHQVINRKVREIEGL